jgi:hypothetical protein
MLFTTNWRTCGTITSYYDNWRELRASGLRQTFQLGAIFHPDRYLTTMIQ